MLRENVLTKTIELICEHYVFADLARTVVEGLRANTPHYLTLNSDEEFASAITGDMLEVTRDIHLTLTMQQQKETERKLAPVATTRFLDDGVALIEITRFPVVRDGRGADALREISDAFMLVRDAPAVIIDVRNNTGGDGSSVGIAISYLVTSVPQLLAIYRFREGTMPGENWTWKKLPHEADDEYRPLADKPICVLVSKDTFSAAEEFAYNLQRMRRATIIGEQTKGGAHPSKRHLIEGAFVLSLPFAETINPISKTNWEGTGILPDIACSRDDALKEATISIRLEQKTRRASFS